MERVSFSFDAHTGFIPCRRSLSYEGVDGTSGRFLLLLSLTRSAAVSGRWPPEAPISSCTLRACGCVAFQQAASRQRHPFRTARSQAKRAACITPDVVIRLHDLWVAASFSLSSIILEPALGSRRLGVLTSGCANCYPPFRLPMSSGTAFVPFLGIRTGRRARCTKLLP